MKCAKKAEFRQPTHICVYSRSFADQAFYLHYLPTIKPLLNHLSSLTMICDPTPAF